eukprot:scaffold699_cov385-Prasinococcus_capsulatus_cf.AAC.12
MTSSAPTASACLHAESDGVNRSGGPLRNGAGFDSDGPAMLLVELPASAGVCSASRAESAPRYREAYMYVYVLGLHAKAWSRARPPSGDSPPCDAVGFWPRRAAAVRPDYRSPAADTRAVPTGTNWSVAGARRRLSHSGSNEVMRERTVLSGDGMHVVVRCPSGVVGVTSTGAQRSAPASWLRAQGPRGGGGRRPYSSARCASPRDAGVRS